MSPCDQSSDRNNKVRFLHVLIIVLVFAGCREQKKHEPAHKENPAKGEILFKSVGCAACHSMTGESKYGPPLNAIVGKEVVVIRQGTEVAVTIDREYLIRSLQDPGAEKVLSYQKRKMPPLNLTQEEINCLVDYIIFINSNNPSGTPGNDRNNSNR